MSHRNVLLYRYINFRILNHHKLLHNTAVRQLPIFPPKKKENESDVGVKTKDLVRVKEFFQDEGVKSDYDKKHFINTLEDFKTIKRIKRFGYGEFVAAALPAMKEFGVEKDIESYKALARIFPEGAFVPPSKISMGFFPHFAQQKAALNIMLQMEENRVMPDKEFEDLIIGAFSKFSPVWQRCARMIYWNTKLRNANPFPFPETIPTDALELAIIALRRMSVDLQSDVTVYSSNQIEDSQEDTWICFAQSDTQRKLIEELDADIYRVSIDGPFQVWVKENSISYFVLFARDMRQKPERNVLDEYLDKAHENNDVSDIPLSNFGSLDKDSAIEPMRSVHEQDDGTILAMIATGTSSQASLVTFIRMLEKENPNLKKIPVVISNQMDSQNEANFEQNEAKS